MPEMLIFYVGGPNDGGVCRRPPPEEDALKFWRVGVNSSYRHVYRYRKGRWWYLGLEIHLVSLISRTLEEE